VLLDLNNNNNLDFIHLSENYFSLDDNINPYQHTCISSSYFDNESFITKFRKTHNPIVINLNVQSLNSKINSLRELIQQITDNDIYIAIIAIQETWNIPHPETVQIPGFNFICKQRTKGRGGGVGFYVKEKIKFKMLPMFSPFSEKIFECITIEAIIANKKTSSATYTAHPHLYLAFPPWSK
jgi:hypothetical protein